MAKRRQVKFWSGKPPKKRKINKVERIFNRHKKTFLHPTGFLGIDLDRISEWLDFQDEIEELFENTIKKKV